MALTTRLIYSSGVLLPSPAIAAPLKLQSLKARGRNPEKSVWKIRCINSNVRLRSRTRLTISSDRSRLYSSAFRSVEREQKGRKANFEGISIRSMRKPRVSFAIVLSVCRENLGGFEVIPRYPELARRSERAEKIDSLLSFLHFTT